MSHGKNKKELSSHITELRNFVITALLVWISTTLLTTLFSSNLVEAIIRPANGKVLHFLNPTDSFFFVVKIHIIAGLVLSLPIIALVIWFYIKDILKEKEKKFALHYFTSTFFLSLMAIVYGYISLIPISLNFLLNFMPSGTTLILSANEYLNFLITLLVALIAVFQTPVLVYGLIHSGLVERAFFTSRRKIIHFFIILIAAILTPTPDVLTMLLISLPISILFELALLVSSFNTNKKMSVSQI